MGFENLPQPIKDEILGKNKDAKDAYYDKLDNEVHITELVGCLTNAFYKRKFPIVETTVKRAYPLYRGSNLDEKFTGLFRRNQLRCTHRVPDIMCTIVGKLDFIDDVTDPANPVLCDLKTIKNLYFLKKGEGAKPEHEIQVRFYAYCNAIPLGKIYYFDYGEEMDFPVEIGDCTELIKYLEQRARILYNSLKTNIAPPIDIKEGEEWRCQAKNRAGEVTFQCEYYAKCYPLSGSSTKTLADYEKESLKAHEKVAMENLENFPVIEVKEKKGKKK